MASLRHFWQYLVMASHQKDASETGCRRPDGRWARSLLLVTMPGWRDSQCSMQPAVESSWSAVVHAFNVQLGSWRSSDACDRLACLVMRKGSGGRW